MTQRKHALVVGCGYVGSKLRSSLSDKGWVVDGIRRNQGLDQSVMAIDVQNEFLLQKKYDVVFYLVAAGGFDSESYRVAYREGVANTLEALKKSEQKPRFIFVSSTSLFSEADGAWVDETSAVDTNGFSKAFLSQGEALVAGSGLDFSIVRFSGIYGPGRMRLVEELRQGKAELTKLPYVSNRIHLDDCVGVCMHLAELGEVAPLYVASDCEPVAYNDLLLWLSQRLQVAPPSLGMLETKSVHRSNKRCSSELLRKSGYRFKFPSYREGFESCFSQGVSDEK